MNIRRWGLTAVACVAVFAALAFFKVMEIKAAIAFGESFPEHSETVEDAVVEVADFTPTIKVMGTVVAAKRLDLHNELAGEITKVNFVSGGHVEAEQILLQLDVSIEQANLAAAEARADLAQSTFARAKDLYGRNAVSKEQLDQAQSDLATSLAEVKVLQRTIDKKTLRAPFAATAGLHQFEVGQYLPENTFITTLVGDSEVAWVDFKVPQFYRPLEIGAEVVIESIGHSNNQVRIRGTVIGENTIVQTENRSRLYRAAIKADNKRFTANTMVSVHVPIGDAAEVLQVPAAAIQYDALGAYVFLLQSVEDGEGFRAHRHQVKIKTTIGDTTLLATPDATSGIKAGDPIAAAGAFKLHEGILVYTKDRAGRSEVNSDNMADLNAGSDPKEAL
ncbi:MAG: efflux transporter periplasmic adaptor subunit [Pseudomonadales bacterium]|nr:efflux transporter periplasmic adaptor subunit [Pseudomonadales bacterium]